jgi:squalene-hopene/tetraprenyl-beta-curcumene cyclase
MPGANTAPFKGTQSYGSITSAGLISLLLSGVDRTDPRVVAAYNWIRKNYTLDSNPGTGGLKDGIFYFYYAFAQAMAAMGDAEVVDGNGQRHNWRNELAAKLISLQSPDGSWVNKDSSRFMQDNAELVSGWALNALNFTLR